MINYDLRHFLLSVTVFVSAVVGSKSRILIFYGDLVVKVHSVDCHEFVNLVLRGVKDSSKITRLAKLATTVSPSRVVLTTSSRSFNRF